MDGYKRFKDPIYGYLDIPQNLVSKIIDTNIFQRLRRIIQTSYSALYSSSVHNRFIHSLGVYYLGQIASTHLKSSLESNSDTKNLTDWAKIKEIFDIACLLHDVGHAPFSHTGERFFLDLDNQDIKKYTNLHTKLINCVNIDEFSKDIPNNENKAAAPHEILSAIIGIENFKDFFQTNQDKEFFARCITGYHYKSNKNDLLQILNCFISLLNSKVIDVDKLDYLIRDSYFSGYQSISIDYQRLLTSIVIAQKETDNGEVIYSLGYTKHAISIIENVVFAHDGEKKWIQSHPIILYEMYILQYCMNKLDKELSSNDNRLFSLKTLSPNGINFDSVGKISLLCDDDIIFLIKNRSTDDLCKEFFSRNERRHPLWKTEAEYKAFFTLKYGNGSLIEHCNKVFEDIERNIKLISDTWIIDDKLIDKLKNDIKNVEIEIENNKEDKSKLRSFKSNLKSKKDMLKVLECFKGYSDENHIPFNYVILNTREFYSGFNKETFEKIPIMFGEEWVDFGKVVSILSSEKNENDRLFYIFYKNSESVNKEELIDKLIYSLNDN